MMQILFQKHCGGVPAVGGEAHSSDRLRNAQTIIDTIVARPQTRLTCHMQEPRSDGRILWFDSFHRCAVLLFFPCFRGERPRHRYIAQAVDGGDAVVTSSYRRPPCRCAVSGTSASDARNRSLSFQPSGLRIPPRHTSRRDRFRAVSDGTCPPGRPRGGRG